MLHRTEIEKEYVRSIREINYYGDAESTPQTDRNEESITSRGHRFRLLDEIATETLQNDEFQVVGWVDRTSDCPYDFILFDAKNEKYYLANLTGRSDGWPLFAIQKGRLTCSRSRMGSQWNCRLCVKYFGEVCKGR